MDSHKATTQVEKRDDTFVERSSTRIWQEVASEDNPYIAEHNRCHGYDLIDLVQKRSFVDVLYLLFRGELPTSEQSQLLEQLLIAQINPGPRHPATQAAMNAGVSRASYSHILPIALSVQGGEHLGGSEVEKAMRYFQQSINQQPNVLAKQLLETVQRPSEADWHIVPGFGSRYGGIDTFQNKIVSCLTELTASGPALNWGSQFAEQLQHHDLGWLSTGVAAAVLTDLGFPPRAGAGMFQIISAPGLLAHGLEMTTQPVTAMPFLDEDHYVIENQ